MNGAHDVCVCYRMILRSLMCGFELVFTIFYAPIDIIIPMLSHQILFYIQAFLEVEAICCSVLALSTLPYPVAKK